MVIFQRSKVCFRGGPNNGQDGQDGLHGHGGRSGGFGGAALCFSQHRLRAPSPPPVSVSSEVQTAAGRIRVPSASLRFHMMRLMTIRRCVQRLRFPDDLIIRTSIFASSIRISRSVDHRGHRGRLLFRGRSCGVLANPVRPWSRRGSGRCAKPLQKSPVFTDHLRMRRGRRQMHDGQSGVIQASCDAESVQNLVMTDCGNRPLVGNPVDFAVIDPLFTQDVLQVNDV